MCWGRRRPSTAWRRERLLYQANRASPVHVLDRPDKTDLLNAVAEFLDADARPAPLTQRRRSILRCPMQDLRGVDRHFADNWVVPVYMGHVVDLSVEWAPYPAARAALANVLSLAGASVETNHWFKPD